MTFEIDSGNAASGTAASGRGPGLSLDVHVADRAWVALLPELGRLLSDTAAAVAPVLAERMTAAGALAPADVSVRLAGDAEVRKLNRTWRGIDGATNVLSFAAWWDDGCPAPAPGQPVALGDVILARETLVAEAKAQNKPVADHFTHLLLHGLLHLLGYDHQKPEDAARMEALEVRLLAGLSVPDPYGPGEGDHG